MSAETSPWVENTPLSNRGARPAAMTAAHGSHLTVSPLISHPSSTKMTRLVYYSATPPSLPPIETPLFPKFQPSHLGRIRTMGRTVPSEVTLAAPLPAPNLASVQVSGGGVQSPYELRFVLPSSRVGAAFGVAGGVAMRVLSATSICTRPSF